MISLRSLYKGLGVLAVAGLTSAFAHASVLSFTATADNVFDAYVSTSATTDGTHFVGGSSWPTLQSGNYTLTAGVTQYLHVRAYDQGPPAMFIGKATLDDTQFWFDNATQTAVTGDAGWTVSDVAFGGATESVLDLGANGTSPWGNFTALGPDARFIWGATNATGDPLYFTLKINTTTTPEPSTFAFMALGGLALVRRRRS